MKTIYKIALSLLAVGVVLSTISWFLTDRNLNQYNVNFGSSKDAEKGIEKTYDCQGDIDSILISDTSIDIEVCGADVDKVKVSVCESESIKYDISEIDNQLTVSKKTTNKNISYNSDTYWVKVYVPKDKEFELNISATSSDITVQHIKLSKVSVGSSSGDCDIYDAVISKSVAVDTTSGDIGISKAEIGENTSLSTTSGDMKLLNVEIAENFKANSTSGDLKFTSVKVLGDISFDATSGDFIGEIVGNQADYSIDFDATSGDCNLPNSNTGTHKIVIRTTSGDAHLTFK